DININLLLKYTNEERVKLGLKKLVLNNQLVEAAEEYVNYLDRKKIYDHIDDARKKIPGIYWVENLGHSFKNEKEAVQGWMTSEGHKRQIISEDYIYFGAAFKNDIW
ncbi:1947_t:CDS:2, partial [Dentiscutata heterogama]